jgi:hypothetical protein
MERPIQVREKEGLLVAIEGSKKVFQKKEFTIAFDGVSPHYGVILYSDFIVKWGFNWFKTNNPDFEFMDPDRWKEDSELYDSLKDIDSAGRSDAIGARQRKFQRGSPATEYSTALYSMDFNENNLHTKVYLRKIDLERYGLPESKENNVDFSNL